MNPRACVIMWGSANIVGISNEEAKFIFRKIQVEEINNMTEVSHQLFNIACLNTEKV